MTYHPPWRDARIFFFHHDFSSSLIMSLKTSAFAATSRLLKAAPARQCCRVVYSFRRSVWTCWAAAALLLLRVGRGGNHGRARCAGGLWEERLLDGPASYPARAALRRGDAGAAPPPCPRRAPIRWRRRCGPERKEGGRKERVRRSAEGIKSASSSPNRSQYLSRSADAAIIRRRKTGRIR